MALILSLLMHHMIHVEYVDGIRQQDPFDCAHNVVGLHCIAGRRRDVAIGSCGRIIHE